MNHSCSQSSPILFILFVLGILCVMPQTAFAAAPTLFAGNVFDDNRDGTVDRINIVFLNGVTTANVGPSEVASDWTYSGGSIGGTLGTATFSGGFVYFTIVGANPGVTGGTMPTVSYNNTDADDSIANADGPMSSQGPITLNDGLAPVIKSATYRDSDADGKIDQLLLTFTETAAGTSVLSLNDLLLSNVGDFTGAAFGTNSTDLITSSVTSLLVTLGTEATVSATYDSSVNIAITTQNSFSLRDTSGNSTAGFDRGLQSHITFIDDADPVLVMITDVPVSGTDTTPSVTFSASEAGTITYGGSCSSGTTSATAGSNTITLSELALGTYGDCTITVTDAASNVSAALDSTDFTIIAEPQPQVSHSSKSGTSIQSRVQNLLTMGNEDAARTLMQAWPNLFPTSADVAPTVSGTFSFVRNLTLGTSGDDVRALQTLLITHATGPASVALSVPGATGYFGPLTRAALMEYQSAGGITPAQGYFGPITRAYISGI